MGIPLSDVSRRTVHRPVMTILIIAANAVVFVMELSRRRCLRAAVVADSRGHCRRAITGSPFSPPMFMHEGWLHIGGNMIFLWAFGPQIEDAMGPFRYLTFYLLCGLAAMLGQIAASPSSTIPNLGASGAIAGVMGAFLVTYPRDGIRTILFLGFFFPSPSSLRGY